MIVLNIVLDPLAGWIWMGVIAVATLAALIWRGRRLPRLIAIALIVLTALLREQSIPQQVTASIPGPVARVSIRTSPVCHSPWSGMIWRVVSPLRIAAVASARRRAVSGSSGVGAGAWSTIGTSRSRSVRKKRWLAMSSSLRISRYFPGRR